MEITRCPNCMAEVRSDEQICHSCGYDRNVAQPANALKRETILHGRYLVGSVIGQGGFGITYVGFDLTLEMKVAIKEYFPSGLAVRSNYQSNQIQWRYSEGGQKQNTVSIERFLKEARKMARLDAVPAVVRVRDAFSENATAYIVMACGVGMTLKDYLQGHGVLNWKDCLHLLAPVIVSLAAIHENGFVHRDISPDNIMIQPSGAAKLLDLGAAVDIMANHGQASMAVVKKSFSAPEQYMETASFGSWTDVYSMAATIYYCMTGKLPPEAMERVYSHTPVLFPESLSIPSHVQEAILRAMDTDTSKRTQNMREFWRQLNETSAPNLHWNQQDISSSPLQGVSPASDNQSRKEVQQPKTQSETLRKAQTSKSRILIAAVLLAVVLLALIGIATRLPGRPNEPETESETEPETVIETDIVLTESPESDSDVETEVASAQLLIKELGLMTTWNADGEVILYSASVAIEDGNGGLLVFARADLYTEEDVSYWLISDERYWLLTEESSLEVSYQGTLDESGLSLFAANEWSGEDVVVFTYAMARIGETATLYYYNSNFEVSSVSLTVTGYEELAEDVYVLEYDHTGTISSAYTPAPVLNADGECIGLMMPAGEIGSNVMAFGKPSE